MIEIVKILVVYISLMFMKVKLDKCLGVEVVCIICLVLMWCVMKSWLICFCKDVCFMSWDGCQDLMFYCDGCEVVFKWLVDEDDS